MRRSLLDNGEESCATNFGNRPLVFTSIITRESIGLCAHWTEIESGEVTYNHALDE